MKLNRFSSFLSLALIPSLVAAPLWSQTPEASGAANDPAISRILQLRVVETDGAEAKTSSRTAGGFTVEVTDTTGAAVPEAAVAFRLPDEGATGTFADGSHAAVVYTNSAGLARISDIRWGSIPGVAAMRVTATKGTSHAGILVEQSLISGGAAAISAPSPVASTSAGIQSRPPAPAQPAQTQAVAKAITPPQQAASIARPAESPIAKPEPEPSVSVTSASPGRSTHSGKAKWIIIAAVAAGAGVGFAMAGRSKSGTSSPSAPSLSIGAPSISVGHP